MNDEVVHGIPKARTVRPGDVVKVDDTAELDGHVADAARTVCVAPVRRRDRALSRVARQALHAGIAAARPGQRVRAIGRAVQGAVAPTSLRIVRELTGHGTGWAIWEEPMVPNVDDPSASAVLTAGLVITIEPILTAGDAALVEAGDGWTPKTRDGSRASHWEHTLIVRDGGADVLTAPG